jgi:hypothetical protein
MLQSTDTPVMAISPRMTIPYSNGSFPSSYGFQLVMPASSVAVGAAGMKYRPWLSSGD